MKGEIWKDIEGYEGLYQVSNMGNVKSLERMKWNGKGYQKIPEKILKGLDNYGYLYVNLWKEGKRKKYRIHRLVAQAFLPNPDNLPCINHKNEIKTDNRASNLEFCSVAYNNIYNGRAKKIGEKNINNPKLSKPVICINKISGLIVEFPSAREAEKCTGIANQNICACCKGRIKSAGGFYWFYADNDDNDTE